MRTLALVAAATVLAGMALNSFLAQGALGAQYGLPQLNPSDLDPTNRNSEVRRALKHLDEWRVHQLESAAGGRFEVTLRNPGRKPVFYTLNDEKQIGLLGGTQRTHRGIGKAEISFDRGLGDSSTFAYTLSEAQTEDPS